MAKFGISLGARVKFSDYSRSQEGEHPISENVAVVCPSFVYVAFLVVTIQKGTARSEKDSTPSASLREVEKVPLLGESSAPES